MIDIGTIQPSRMCLETKNYQKTNSYLNILDKTIRNSLHKNKLNLDKSD